MVIVRPHGIAFPEQLAGDGGPNDGNLRTLLDVCVFEHATDRHGPLSDSDEIRRRTRDRRPVRRDIRADVVFCGHAGGDPLYRVESRSSAATSASLKRFGTAAKVSRPTLLQT